MPVEMLTDLAGAAWALLASNALTAFGLLGLGMLAYWVFDELEEAEDKAELIERTGERANQTVGDIGGSGRALLLVGGSTGAMLASELAATLALFEGLPFLLGHLVFGILTFAGLGGYIPLTVYELGLAFVAITVTSSLALIRYRSTGGASSA
ncbi:hypothetical protein [Halobaculum sp. EA56]|uniref:hypothetical protein n=1 Tax=Halobaculum sp. EA56 TaxID=3421648 RepID=UPI003EBDDA3B